MAFILCKDFDEENPRDFPFLMTRYNDYKIYLESISQKIPSSARDFALADWRSEPQFHECPHDAWVEFFNIHEVSSGDRKQYRYINIEVRLLGAYHDGFLDLTYEKVKHYSLNKPFLSKEVVKNETLIFQNHNDWLYDEVRLSENGFVLHEIEFVSGTEWLIECEDIKFNWIPFEK